MRRKISYLSVVLMVAILAGYVFVYQMNPFSDNLNKLILASADSFAALLAAIAVTAVLFCYRKEDKPYLVWLHFALGLWAWVLAETVWLFIDLTSSNVPSVGAPDVFWIIGYVLLTLALRSQYQLLYKTKHSWWKVVAIWAGIILAVFVTLLLVGSQFTLGNFVNYFYAIIDFVLCIVAIRLFLTFGGGKLSRPWIGLFVMGISDAVWAWLNATGQYQASSDAGTWLSVFTDTTYVAAYLILAIGFLMQYLLLRLGPEES
ncbi:MAG: hypothetical protein WA821_14490 [Anaerolineales bacterium]